MRGFFVSLGALTLLTACGTLLTGGSSVAGEKDLKAIQGTWRFVTQAMGGKERAKEELAGLTITFDGDKWAVRLGDKVVQGGTNKFDSSKKPAHVDATVTEGEGKGGKMLGIVELNGDTMKVCFDPLGKERPTSLTSKVGQFSATVERVKKK